MQKKIPQRKCLGCGEEKPKREMIRVVRSPEGVIALDFKGKAPGRGAYICPNKSCFAKAKKTRRLEKNFECAIPDEIYQSLEEELGKYE